MAQQRILVDLDSIVVDLLSPWLAAYDEAFGDSLTVADVTNPRLHEIVVPQCGDRIYELLDRPAFFEELEPLPGALDALKRLSAARDVELLVVTAAMRPEHAKGKLRWCEQHLPPQLQPNVVVTRRKELIPGALLIDDLPWNLEAYRRAWPGARLASIAYPYNADAPLDLRAEGYRDPAAAWREILAFVERELLAPR